MTYGAVWRGWRSSARPYGRLLAVASPAGRRSSRCLAGAQVFTSPAGRSARLTASGALAATEPFRAPRPICSLWESEEHAPSLTHATMTDRPDRPIPAGAPPLLPVVGRPVVGPMLKARIPRWVMHQLDALTLEASRRRRETAIPSERGRRAARADTVRDVLIAGLVAMREHGVQAPGFNPARAVLDAAKRGEPTGTALDRRSRATEG